MYNIEELKLGGGWYAKSMYGVIIKDERYEHSGDTMFDVDRENGGTLNTCAAGKKFWSLIYAAQKAKPWPYNYDGGELRPQLMELLVQMMEPALNVLMNMFLSPEAIAIINKDAKLYFYFLYTNYNGAGFFRYFSAAMNIYVKRGITDPSILIEKMIEEKENVSPAVWNPQAVSLIKQGAKDLRAILPGITGGVEEG